MLHLLAMQEHFLLLLFTLLTLLSETESKIALRYAKKETPSETPLETADVDDEELESVIEHPDSSSKNIGNKSSASLIDLNKPENSDESDDDDVEEAPLGALNEENPHGGSRRHSSLQNVNLSSLYKPAFLIMELSHSYDPDNRFDEIEMKSLQHNKENDNGSTNYFQKKVGKISRLV